MSEELKPCPCCGSTNVHSYNSKSAQYRQYSIKCKKCGLRVCKATLPEAIEVWNTRTERTAKVSNQFVVSYRPDVMTKHGDCECGRKVSWLYEYCPDCGARLEWE